MDWLKKLPAWLKGLIALFTSIIGFVFLFLSNIYLSITISTTVILVAIFCLSMYLVFSKKRSEVVDGRYINKFPNKYRYPALAGLVGIPLLIAMFFVNKPTRTFAIISFVGTATPTTTPTITPSPTPTVVPSVTPSPTALPLMPSIENVVVGQVKDHYNMEITALNPLEQDLLVTQIIIRENCSLIGSGFSIPSYTPMYVISDQITIIDSTEDSIIFEAEVIPEAGELSGYSITAYGFFIGFPTESCDYFLNLQFDTSFLLLKNSYTSFYLKIPKQFHDFNEITEPKALEGFSGPIELSLTKPNTPEEYEIFEINLEVETNYLYTMTYTLDLLN